MSAEKELMLKQADAETTYQKKLTAGTNITIDPVTNVISSAGGGSTVQYTDNVPNGESVGILAINRQSHPIRIPRLAEGTGITITKDISTNVYTISSTGGGSGTTKSYMGETDPDELVGEDGDLYFKYHKIETDVPTELTLPSLPDDATVPFPITDFNSYDSFTFYYTDGNNEPHNRKVNTGDLVISDSPADESPNSNIYTWNSYRYIQATRSTNGEGLVLRVCGNCLYKLEANVTEVDLGIDKSYAKVEDTWLPSGEQVEANPEETSETPLTKIKIDGVTYYIAAGGSAEIVPLTKAEWDALPASKYTDNILYLITDSFTTETIITPNPEGEATDTLTKLQIDETIYSLAGGSGSGEGYEETVLWTGAATASNTILALSDNITNYDDLLIYGATIFDSNGTITTQLNTTQIIPVSQIEYGVADEITKGYMYNVSHGQAIRRAVMIFTDASHFVVSRGGENDTTECGFTKVVGIKYSSGGGSSIIPNPEEEPTDTLNSIKIDGTVYNIESGSEGEGVEIYSEDEYIVGSININGIKKKIYQKTFVLNNITVTQSSGYSYDITSLGIEDVVESPRGFVKITNSDRRSIPFNLLSGYGFTATVKPNQILLERAGNNITISQAVVTIRYTKTVETDAPAWGGSVTNNYANFIDTSNVIQAETQVNSGTTGTYTATEDCYIRVKLWRSSTGSSSLSIDGVEVLTNYSDSGTSALYNTMPLKKGQTATIDAGAGSPCSYTVYGISYGSGSSSSESSVHYSTTEQVIGTWIDGKPLYQKSYENLNIGTDQNYSLTLSDLQNIEYLRVVPEGSQVSAIVPFPYTHYNSNNNISYFIDSITNGVPTLAIRKGYEMSSQSNLQFLTIQYTKTTD